MPTRDERREVAERLRENGRVLREIDADIETAALTLDDVLGVGHTCSWQDAFDMLADLIDPTCEIARDNRFASDFDYICKACGEHFSVASTPRYCPGCGRRIDYGNR